MAKKKKSKKRKFRAAKSRKFESVPKGFHSVTPYLVIKGAALAVEWYKKAFGAKEFVLERQATPEGQLIHARIEIGDSLVMMSDIFPSSAIKDPMERGHSPVTLHIYTKDVDSMWKRAVEAGAKEDMPLDNMFWGERYGQLTDPFGHSWSLSMRIQMPPHEMEQKRQEAMKMFEQGQHP